MSEAIITVEGLGKKYRISHQAERQRYVALRDVIAQKLKAPFQFLRRSKIEDRSLGLSPNSHLPSPRTSTSEDFWALKDVSFEVKRGEVVGIIGRNGAGKSTLLKILSRITEPTTGRVHLRGRVASLLEVGTGFHPELTGRENVFLNGAILGMHRVEIKRKFDEIVAFAEVEKFLDTPVKRYSSGMYVRLAFAVAAHLEPEILIVDEVLAVGDAQFQKKCLGKMGEVAKGGRTVLFVSHNMAAVISLCDTALVLNGGWLRAKGKVRDMIAIYQQNQKNSVESGHIGQLKYFVLQKLSVCGLEGKPLTSNDPLEIRISYCARNGLIISPDVYIAVSTQEGIRLAGFLCSDIISERIPGPSLIINLVVALPSIHLMPGKYNLDIELKDIGSNKWEFLPESIPLEIENSPIYGTRAVQSWNGLIALKPKASWTGIK
jgi:lipopolysaccharide transport system ATP-binding protein